MCEYTCTKFHVWPLWTRTRTQKTGWARGKGSNIHEVVSAYAQTRCAFVACVVEILCAILRIPIRVYSLNSLFNWHLIKIRPFTTPLDFEIGEYKIYSQWFSYNLLEISVIFIRECQQCERDPAIFYIVVAFASLRLPVVWVVGISRCKHYLVLGFGRLWKLVGHEVRSRCFCVVNFASVCLLRWRNFRKTRYGMVRPWYTSVALVAVCDLTYSACGDDTCQLNLWNVKHYKCYARVNCER